MSNLPFDMGVKNLLEHLTKPLKKPVFNERKTVFLVSLGERARAEEKNHRGTEDTEKVCDLSLRALCASVVQPSSQNRGSLRASLKNLPVYTDARR